MSPATCGPAISRSRGPAGRPALKSAAEVAGRMPVQRTSVLRSWSVIRRSCVRRSRERRPRKGRPPLEGRPDHQGTEGRESAVRHDDGPPADKPQWRSDQRGAEDGVDGDRPRHPGPSSPGGDPAAVVERREPPGLIIDPRPAPGSHPCPVPVMVGRPAGHGDEGDPARPEAGNDLPAAVLVEVFDPVHFARNIARGNKVILSLVAHGHPLVPGVRRSLSRDPHRRRVG